nr:chemotaxis protein CheD [uncultured Sphingomonas sp.]
MNLSAITRPHAILPPQVRRQHVNQGECGVSSDPLVIFSTVLGSCVSACLFDPVARVGGMNHFLLASGGEGEGDARLLQRYGVHAMEVLINGMLQQGAARSRLRARLFGGASMNAALPDIGGDNIAFARTFLDTERIALIAEDVGGTVARRVDFQPTAGRVRCRRVVGQLDPPLQIKPPKRGGQFEIF